MFFYKKITSLFLQTCSKTCTNTIGKWKQNQGRGKTKRDKKSKKGNRIRANLTPLKTVTWGHGLASGIMDQKHTHMTCGCDTTGFAKCVPILLSVHLYLPPSQATCSQ